MKTIAFYLPQFHPIPENDEWWGKGFTEWTNVTRANPLFPGHYQPRLPADLGFYDLRLAEVRNEQAHLAKKHGLHGFCYHYYWFNGKKLLDLPLREVLESKEPNFPFCICYANENWTRRWDGQEKDILIRQEHSPENDRRFIQDIIPILKDNRYIKVGNRPLILVYRVTLFPNPFNTAKIWREEAKKAGIEDLFLCKCKTFDDFDDPVEIGFDAMVEFPPHGLKSIAREFEYENLIKSSLPSFKGYVFDYNDVANQMMTSQWPEYKLFKTVMLGWDNTSRNIIRPRIFKNFSIDSYERWLLKVCKRTIERYPEDERFVFINAWNEWAEGTYLEPDQKFGHEYLRATRNAILAAQSLEEILSLCKNANFHDETIKGILHYLHKKDETEIILMKILEEKEAKVVNLEAQLNARALCYKLRDKLFPRGTKRRIIAKKIRDRIFD
ncbi:MAG: glycoside hydrolase family 99-like domain-containing protein [Nitrospirae bacterium]|nr:glycoside hydrolase family 99-like domain-containing protein [Nitrospirota bacterium]